MSVEYLNTPGVPEPQGFTHMVPRGLAPQARRPGPEVPVLLVGVQSLFQPDMLVEIEGVAIR
jgi:hypothetical protein